VEWGENILEEFPFRPEYLVLQWHVTERCNFRCAHCYQESYAGDELPFPALIQILDQFKRLISQIEAAGKGARLRAHINVTGGEPFVRKDFFELLDVFHENRDKFSFGILTNGSLLDSRSVRRLKELHPQYVQISIDGTRETNDRIRARGGYDLAVSAIKNLVREGIPTHISFTAQRINHVEFQAVSRLARELRVQQIWADRLVPWGQGAAFADQTFSPGETKAFFESMYLARVEAQNTVCRTEISLRRALQFLVGGGSPYRCAAGGNLLAVQPNGDVYPCRRMPIRVGNLMERSLSELYFRTELFQRLRKPDSVPGECSGCRYASQCGGGLKCLSYAQTGDPFTPDPGCWRIPRPSTEVKENHAGSIVQTDNGRPL
jgi:radical SAM protein with 4Fe4S-binding SPASM domain